MRLQTFLVFLLVAFCSAEEEEEVAAATAAEAQRIVRAPQGHIQYDDSNGYRVSWKLFAPYTQWTSELENIQSSESKSQDTEHVPEIKTSNPQERILVSTIEKQEYHPQDKQYYQQEKQHYQQQQEKQHYQQQQEKQYYHQQQEKQHYQQQQEKQHYQQQQEKQHYNQQEKQQQQQEKQYQQQEQQQQQQQQQIEPAVEYKPYSMVPTYIKQLIFKMYEPQGPYVDPKVYIYHTPVEVNIDDKKESSSNDNEQEKNAERRQETIHNHDAINEPIRQYSYAEQETASQQQVPQRIATTQQELSPSLATSSLSSSSLSSSSLLSSSLSSSPSVSSALLSSPSAPSSLLSSQSLSSSLLSSSSPSLASSASSKDDATKQTTNDYQNPIIKKKTYYGKYPLKEIGHIEYKKDEGETKSSSSSSSSSSTAQYGFVPPQQLKNSESISSTQDSSLQDNIMPSLIQQLLNLQAQIPYYVIANRINYKPKKMFIPKPIVEDEKGAYSYRSKVYYMRDDDNEENESKQIDKINEKETQRR